LLLLTIINRLSLTATPIFTMAGKPKEARFCDHERIISWQDCDLFPAEA